MELTGVKKSQRNKDIILKSAKYILNGNLGILMAISRSEALEIAENYVKTCPLEEGVGISEILSIEETGRRPSIYGYPDEKMKYYWIAYVKEPSKLMMLSSSTILLISKENGEIIYAGSAYD